MINDYNRSMQCIILANQVAPFPPALLPMKVRAVIDYLLDDVLLQRDISNCTIVTNEQSLVLMQKHIRNTYPTHPISVVISKTILNVISQENDILLLQGNVFTSLKLQDFIRYYKQFKTVTNAVYDKQSPKEIPFQVIPKKFSNQIDKLPEEIETHTYNCGSGYMNIII
jgi:NDP-sugar pyrophosphorylase family protein